MKFQKSIGAIIADSRRYFLQRCKIKIKFQKNFSCIFFFQKQKNFINNIPCFPAWPWNLKKNGWANTPL
jgi:hypothetical protein